SWRRGHEPPLRRRVRVGAWRSTRPGGLSGGRAGRPPARRKRACGDDDCGNPPGVGFRTRETLRYIKSSREMILILDFGSQYTQLIARRVREAHVYCESHPFEFAVEKIRALKPRGIILSGGTSSTYDEDAPDLSDEVLRLGCPVLGICYGLYIIAQHLGARSVGSRAREYGPATLTIDESDLLFEGLAGKEHRVWMSH